MSMSQLLRVVYGTVLVILGGFFFVAAPTQTLAQTTGYTTSWTATKVLTADSSGGWQGVGVLRNVPIGVSEWQVTGTDTSTGTTLFTETWTAPIAGDITFNPADRSTTGSGFNASNWLFASHVGVFGDTPNGGRVTYKNQPVSILNPGYTFNLDQVRVGGNAINCIQYSGDSNCLHTRSAYGWEVYHALDCLSCERGRISASGFMMPLKWTIVGTIN